MISSIEDPSPAGSVDRQQHGFGAVGLRACDVRGDVVGGEGVDHAVEGEETMLGPEAWACAATCPRTVTEINAAPSASRAVAEAIRVTTGVSPSVNSIPRRRGSARRLLQFLSRSLRPSVAATKGTMVPMATRRTAWDHRRIGKLRTPDPT